MRCDAMRKSEVEVWLLKVVMTFYSMARTVMRTRHEDSISFEVDVDVHQSPAFSPLLQANTKLAELCVWRFDPDGFRPMGLLGTVPVRGR